MRWPPWSSSPSSEPPRRQNEYDKKKKPITWSDHLTTSPFSVAELTSPPNLFAVAVITTSTLLLARLWRLHLRRVPGATSIQPEFFRKRSFFGRVTSVGDGDNFRLFHTPGGRWMGWGWVPGRKVPTKRDELKDRTIHIRLAGVDAPEQSHFGRPAQPYSAEALAWLRSYILHRRVRAYVYKRDQYERVVATVYVRRGLLRRDVGLQMLKRGWATVYEAKSGAEFGALEDRYRRAEWWARKRRSGMWKSGGGESPREYKTRYGVGGGGGDG
ncbi:MAG: putative endonuclease lcl3 [Piccolia ochrophora]|nr:MAG: putative endonuclease lcl3 [Piccolia ochrophora]